MYRLHLRQIYQCKTVFVASLGIKSPFVVFRSEHEVLSNNSVLLNLTEIRNKLKAVQNLDHFIRPIDSSSSSRREQTTGLKGGDGTFRHVSGTELPTIPPAAPPVFSAESAFSGRNVSITFLTTVAPSFVNHFEKTTRGGSVLSRPTAAMGQHSPPSVIGTADHMISDDDGGSKKERKYIIPLALKTSTNEKEKTSSVFHGSSTNIDDLKRHILMLQNLTQSDKNFQSKFVVFPSLQKNGTTPGSTPSVAAVPSIAGISNTDSQRQLAMAAGLPAPSRGEVSQKEYRNVAIPGRGRSAMGEKNSSSQQATMRTAGYGATASGSINVPKKAFPEAHDILSDRKDAGVGGASGGLQMYKTEKITIVPQVFLQNDQTSETVSDKEVNLGEPVAKVVSVPAGGKTIVPIEQENPTLLRTRATKRKNAARRTGNKSVTSVSSSAEGSNQTGLIRSSTVSAGGNSKKLVDLKADGQQWVPTDGQLVNGTTGAGGRKGEGKKKRKNGRRRGDGGGGRKQTVKSNDESEQPKTVILNDDASIQIDGNDRQDAGRDKDHAAKLQQHGPGISGSRKWNPSSRVRRNDFGGRQQATGKQQHQQQYYATNGRTYPMGKGERHDSRMMTGSLESLFVSEASGAEASSEYNNRNQGDHRNRTSGDGNEKDIVDLNPDLCYTLDALSSGQQKLCAQHTSIMPAISRGARAAIQECKHQFRNRRWNCSIVDDDTVFGPISNIGSPEMAFVYAMAAAAASSFIARACRDGQLASCGCSRSSRPSKLNEDWTWGGCGDDMEFGYKFTQTFIDIREKEKKRGTRGLVSIPAKYPKIIERLLDALNDTTKTGGMLNETDTIVRPEDLEKLQDKIAKEIANSNLPPKEISDLQERINKEITNSEVFNLKNVNIYDKLKKIFRKPEKTLNGVQFSASAKARALMNLHNNEAGRRAVIKKSRIICKCHGVSGSCSLITCWQQLSSIREIGDFLREKYDEATQVKVNKRGRLQVKDPRYQIPSALDLIYLDESPDWCRVNRQLKWQGTHGRVCNKTSSGLDGCSILCCGRGYNTKKIIVKERCNCKFQWCCQVKCEICTRSIEEYTCK
ncbi:AGAP010290-PA-like protein [Anopheles sinensis]|uniref:Protein Wnt n=1 Tax=Anopheles sinensis TaxID=74873 RepID=A0A084W5N0_ANOSI|nr:AGAP010290-PA-like protein [Anopheles sinensis]